MGCAMRTRPGFSSLAHVFENNSLIDFKFNMLNFWSYLLFPEFCKSRPAPGFTTHLTNTSSQLIDAWRIHLSPNQPILAVIFILPLIEIFKFHWLRQKLYAAVLCFLTNLIFLIYPLHVTY